MSLSGADAAFQALPALGFADRVEAEQGLPALLEGRGNTGGPVVADSWAAAHPFVLGGLAGFAVAARGALSFDCRPQHYLVCLAQDGSVAVGETCADAGQALVVAPDRFCRLRLGDGGLMIALLVPAEAMAGLSGCSPSLPPPSFPPAGPLPLELWPWRLLPGFAAILLAGLGLAPAALGATVGAAVSSPSPSVPRHVKRAEDYMARHMAQPLTVTELAAQVGASPRSLNRAFIRFRGVTPSRHLQNLRIEAAHRLLSSDDCLLDLREVAAQVGFGSYAPFWRAYVRRYGRPPSVGRRRAGGTPSP